MSHVSYSALKIFNDCPFKYKLIYEDKVGLFAGSEYTIFGTAIHEAAELKVQNEEVDEQEIFINKFESEIALLKENKVELKEDLLEEMRVQGRKLAKEVVPALQDKFGFFKVLSAEEDLFEVIEGGKAEAYNFKGYIDLVIRTSDGKIHIIDYKTSTWGWNRLKRSDTFTSYQLILYKHFYAKKHNVDPKNIEVHFAILKRAAKKDLVEFFRISSGEKKTTNALNVLNNGVYNIDKKNFPKNKLNCSNCEFHKTKDCP